MSDTKIAASFRVSLTALMPKPDHRSQMARAWLHFHAARKGRGSGVQPRVSTGLSIHAAPSITPSPSEGIEDGPRLRLLRAPALRPVSGRNLVATGSARVTLPGRRQKAFLAVGSAQRGRRVGGASCANPLPLRARRARPAEAGQKGRKGETPNRSGRRIRNQQKGLRPFLVGRQRSPA